MASALSRRLSGASASSASAARPPRRLTARALAAKRANFADRVLEGLPVVGVLRALFSPEGLKTRDVGYNEYTRRTFDGAGAAFGEALSNVQLRHGRAGDARFVLFCMWIAAEGAAVVALNRLSVDMRQEGILSVRRLSVQCDLEYEVEVFERLRADPSFVQARDERPAGRGAKGAALVALICELVGVAEGEALALEDAADVAEILRAFDGELADDEIEALLKEVA